MKKNESDSFWDTKWEAMELQKKADIHEKKGKHFFKDYLAMVPAQISGKQLDITDGLGIRAAGCHYTELLLPDWVAAGARLKMLWVVLIELLSHSPNKWT